MTTHPRSPNDDARVTAWLRARTPEPPPDDLLASISAATAELRTVPGWWALRRGHHLRAPMGRGRTRWLIPAVALIVLGGLGAVIAIGGREPDDRAVVPLPAPSPADAATPAPSRIATPAPSRKLSQSELIPYTNERDGYSVMLPRAWHDTERPTFRDAPNHPTSFGFANAGDGPALNISIGGPDGSIWTCRGTNSCTETVVHTLDELGDALVSTPSFFGTKEITGVSTLGGWTARSEKSGTEHNCLGCPEARHHIFVIVDGRPIVFAFNYWNVAFARLGPDDAAGTFSASEFDAVLQSFRLTTATPTPSPTQPPEALAVYRSVRDAYSLLLPKAWRDTVRVEDGGLTRFGSARAGGDPALTISIGDAGGAVTLCQPACERVVVRTLEELEAALVSDPPNVPGSDDVAGMGWLGDTPAHVEKAGLAHSCLGCPARYHVFTFDGGRPIVLAFNFWNVTWNGLGPGADGGPFSDADLEAVLRSFVFPPRTGRPSPTPPPSDWPSEGWHLVPYENTEYGYSVQLPEAWRDSARPLDGGTSVTAFGHQPSGAGEAGLTISVGELDGSVDVCPTADTCQRIVVRSLADLADTLRVTPNFIAGDTLHSVGYLGPTDRPRTPVELFHSCLDCPGARHHVFTIVHGRPIVFSFDDWTVRGFMDPAMPRLVVQVYDFGEVLGSFVLWSGP